METLNWFERWERKNIRQIEEILVGLFGLGSVFVYLLFVGFRCLGRLVFFMMSRAEIMQLGHGESIRDRYPRI